MFIEQPPFILRRIWRAHWRLPRTPKCVYLTFDDGPCPDTTPQLLDILDSYGVKATFFCVGDNVRKHPALFDELLRRGHAVGNHTMHHLRGFNYTEREYIKDVMAADSLIRSPLFRPPYGRITLKQIRHLKRHFTVIMWDVITRDYNARLTPEKVTGIVKRYSRNGSIIVFHDSVKASKNMFRAIRPSIEWLKEQGYEFRTLYDVT